MVETTRKSGQLVYQGQGLDWYNRPLLDRGQRVRKHTGPRPALAGMDSAVKGGIIEKPHLQHR